MDLLKGKLNGATRSWLMSSNTGRHQQAEVALHRGLGLEPSGISDGCKKRIRLKRTKYDCLSYCQEAGGRSGSFRDPECCGSDDAGEPGEDG